MKDTKDYITIPLSKTGSKAGLYEAIVDNCDKDLADYNWSVHSPTKNNKSAYAIRVGNIRLHRVILERMLDRPLKRGETVDHINGNGLDNRRSNLRLATIKQNNRNSPKYSNNTSGYKGVTWRKDCQKWQAAIKVDGRNLGLGTYDNPKDAHNAYCEAAKRYYGEFANTGE